MQEIVYVTVLNWRISVTLLAASDCIAYNVSPLIKILLNPNILKSLTVSKCIRTASILALLQ